MKIEDFKPSEPQHLPEFLFYGLTQTADEINDVLRQHLTNKRIKNMYLKYNTDEDILESIRKPYMWLVIEFYNDIVFEIDIHDYPWRRLERLGSIVGVEINDKKARGTFYLVRKSYNLFFILKFYIRYFKIKLFTKSA